MFEKLQAIYRSKLVTKIENYDFNTYVYFINEFNLPFGILKEALTDHEKQLIELNYTPIKEEHYDDASIQFINYLFGVDNHSITFDQVKYYFVKVFDDLDEEMESAFVELLKSFFNQQVMIQKRQSIYILVQTSQKDDVNFHDLLQSIESDFMIPLLGYESEVFKLEDPVPTYFQMDAHNMMGIKYNHDLLLSKSTLIKQDYINHFSTEDKKRIKEYVLKPYLNDQDMLKVIRVYFESNFNTTLAAKMCYMHRNTFLNKIDKFSMDTGFNIREYEDALIVYLAILF